MNKKKAIVFDFDGTLIDSLKLEADSMLFAINSFPNAHLTVEELIKHYGPTEKGIIKSLVDDSFFNKAYEAFLKYYQKEAPLYKVPIPIIKALINLKNNPNISLFLITGRGKDTLDISLDVNKLNNFFIREYTGSETGVNKDVSMNKLIDDFNLKKEDILYIGDTISDINVMNKINVDILSVSYFSSKEYHELLEIKNNGKVVSDICMLETYINYYIK